jgi:hypothetical protein
MRILDLVDLPESPSFFDPGAADLRQTLVFLRHFARDLAAPVIQDGREHIEYVPTQAFTEYVRFQLKDRDGQPVDGIRYRSAVNGEPCYVLFCGRDECVAKPEGRGKIEHWLTFDPGSLKIVDAKDVAGSRPVRIPMPRLI